MAEVTVFSGNFASQPLAFAHLLDECEAAGLSLDLDHVEVICGGDPRPRLTHALGAGAADTIRAAMATDSTAVLIFPEALIPGARLFEETALLRHLGRFAPATPRTRT